MNIEEFLEEHDAPRNTGAKRKSGYYPVNKNSADYQDYLAECEKIERQQKAENAARDKKRKDEEFAAEHYCPEPTIEYEDLPNNQNACNAPNDMRNTISGCIVLVLVVLAIFWRFGAL